MRNTGPAPTRKPLEFIGTSREDLKDMPEDVQDAFGRALLKAQFGEMPAKTKPFQGYGGASVLEIIEVDDGNTYRAIYTVRFAGIIYVLHCFQKKSKHGIATTRQDIELVERRLRDAEVKYREWLRGGE